MELKTIFLSEGLSVEHYYAKDISHKKVAFIFSPLMNKHLSGNLYGGELLFRNGYDVVSFKSIENNWFQSVPGHVLQSINEMLFEAGYEKRVGYGGSLGGYAAIAFSKIFDFDIVLAISPQYSTKESYDGRWLQFTRSVNWKYEITPETINPNCKYFLIYDDLDRDAFHINSLSKLINPSNLSTKIISGSGHPTTHHMEAIGVLKGVAVSVLENFNVDGIDLNKPLPLKPDPKFSKASFKSNLGPNDLCPCGRIDPQTNKQKKYKKCCM